MIDADGAWIIAGVLGTAIALLSGVGWSVSALQGKEETEPCEPEQAETLSVRL